MKRDYFLRVPPKVKKKCPNCGRVFEVSRLNTSKVLCSRFCLRPVLHRLVAKTVINDTGCWLWTGSRQRGNHGKIYFEGGVERTHRVSWMLFHGDIPEGLCVLHNCIGTANCWNPNHLRLGTQLENVQDRVDQGREGNHKGTANGRALVTDEEVLWMRANYCRYGQNGKLSSMALARKFNLPQATVWQIVNGKCWKHLDR